MVSCHDRTYMATKLEMMTTTLERMLEAVSVTTLCTPATSLVRRDWISPVRVEVKKRNDSACRWAYSRLRRSRINRRPTEFDSQVWPTPMRLVTIGIAMPKPTRRYSSGRLGQGWPLERPGGWPE